VFHAILGNAGLNPRRLVSAIRGWKHYVSERSAFKDAEKNSAWPWARELPILSDWNESSGSLGAYFFQDQIVARWIFDNQPKRHVDIGSRLDGFVGHLSVFRKVDVIDIRPQTMEVPNIAFYQLDLMKNLSTDWIECTDSLSCLHTVEHFGLGRYGDPINPYGHLE